MPEGVDACVVRQGTSDTGHMASAAVIWAKRAVSLAMPENSSTKRLQPAQRIRDQRRQGVRLLLIDRFRDDLAEDQEQRRENEQRHEFAAAAEDVDQQQGADRGQRDARQIGPQEGGGEEPWRVLEEPHRELGPWIVLRRPLPETGTVGADERDLGPREEPLGEKQGQHQHEPRHQRHAATSAAADRIGWPSGAIRTRSISRSFMEMTR